MTAAKEKDNVLADYTAFLTALLPQTVGVMCYDRTGQLFWTWNAPDASGVELTDEYCKSLTAVLKSDCFSRESARIHLGAATAYIARLEGAKHRSLGALTVLVDRKTGSMPYQFCMDMLQPGLRSLQRELVLRFRLLDSHKKLSVQAAEEKLLHSIEQISHQRQRCEVTLNSLLEQCQKYLGVESAILVVPEKRIRLTRGTDVVSSTEVELMLQDYLQETGSTSKKIRDGRSPNVNADGTALSMLILKEGRRISGMLSLGGWTDSDFSLRRRSRVLRYLVSNIEDVIDRDYDALTGLMSWGLFDSVFVEACKNAETRHHAMLNLDLDQMHVVNDSFGRDGGDKLLQRFSDMLRDKLPGSLLARITGDNFVALLTDTKECEALEIAEQICDVFREMEYVEGNQTHRPSVSIGVGPFCDVPESASAILSSAQVACQAAKDRGRGRVEVFRDADASIVRRLDDIQMVGQVRSAIENGRLATFAQPIIGLQDTTNHPYLEVLVRLRNDNGDFVAPADFFSSAERYQLMEDLDRWVIAETLATLEANRKTIQEHSIRFAINLSGQSLGSDRFLEFVLNKVETFSMAPEILCFELTETVAVANLQRAEKFMKEIKSKGCRLSLDDFGTGLSSFAYLKQFPVDTLKIDGSFIFDLPTNVVSQSVVSAISGIARTIGLETVAEYVQDEDTMALLRQSGVTWAQGYHLGVPEPLGDQINAIKSSACPQDSPEQQSQQQNILPTGDEMIVSRTDLSPFLA